MRRKHKLVCAACLGLALLLALPGTAGAFFFLWPFGSFGNNLGWGGGYPNWGGFGGPNFGYSGIGPHYPNYGYGPFMYSPFTYGMSYSYSGPISLPGFAASGYSPRWRSSLYPALAANTLNTLNNGNDGLIIPASSEAPDDRARLEVRVPAANAQVWLDGVRMSQSGADRRFVTPPLDRKSRYSYEIKVRWSDGGTPRAETRRVSVRAGDSLMVDFRKDR